MATIKTLADAHNELTLANNGYVIAAYLDPELRRQMERVCKRGNAFAGRVLNHNNILVKAYFTLDAKAIYKPLPARLDA